MSSAICPRFAQNAWKKDLCSNCFKSKEEHKSAVATTKSTVATYKTEIPNKNAVPLKGIIKGVLNRTKKNMRVTFPKKVAQVIGYGGEWSDADTDDDDDDFMTAAMTSHDDVISSTDEEENLELKRLTKHNTDFNTDNGNLLGDPQENIKKSFAALKLGAPQVDKEGKKQTLKICVTPFGSTGKLTSVKAKFEAPAKTEEAKVAKPPEVKKEILKVTTTDGKSSPPIERAMEKSLLDEISETLEKNQQKEVKTFQSDKDGKIKFEISSLTDAVSPKPFPDLKKPIARNAPITKDHIKPKISVFQKYSDTDSNCSDSENGVSAYYDVVETTTTTSGYENLPDGKALDAADGAKDTSVFSSSQYITDMLLSSKTLSASYSLHEGNFMTSKITSDGLIVTKCSSDDALDSTGSSFDGSSDEETSYSMNRSESDSGIGISIGSEYKAMKEKERVEMKLSASTNNSDYEDIQLAEDVQLVVDKSRELAGEPDGSADPDGKNTPEVIPALPKSPPPPTPIEERQSFLHGLQKKKPDLPAKPSAATVMKTFAKRQPSQVEQQVISQLQQVMKQPTTTTTSVDDSKLSLTRKEGSEQAKLLKKGRAPNPPAEEQKTSPPPTPEKDYNSISFESSADDEISETKSKEKIDESHQHLTIYTRNPTVGSKATSTLSSSPPVIREKDKRERATVNPKFRSLNTFATQRKSQQPPPLTPEPTPRKNLLSMSEECLVAIDDKNKKKNKFSIKKFLRMGTSKTTDNLHKKDGIYSEIVTGDELSVAGGKPRLVIIHPIDINPTAVEVVKDMTQTNEPQANVQTIAVLTKPPAPPQRLLEGGKSQSEMNKPARPPPPKSAELRRKQKIGFNVSIGGGSVKCKSDNVYANLGEIRSAIAPRKPERTASMREREAQLELARKRQGLENSDTISVCSSNGGNAINEVSTNPGSPTPSIKIVAKTDQTAAMSRQSTIERKHLEMEGKVASKLEIFEKGIVNEANRHSLKDSVRKINSTIDSYLKDKRDYENMYDFVKSTIAPPAPPVRSSEPMAIRTGSNPRRTQFTDSASVSGASYTTRSEFGPSRYGLNSNSLANIPRVISASYCGSEMGESDIYSPYSYYGSEAGGDVAGDINDSVWGIPSAVKNRIKTTNRLRMRKGRSVVHKSIEDNYTAVVVANHEALAQVLDQLQQTPQIPAALRPLANAINLRFEDFTILEGAQAFVVGKKAFHAAIWSMAPVTLALSADCNQLSGVGGELSQLSGGVSGVLNPITEFCDLVPNYQLPLMPSTEVRLMQATISVLPRLQLDTLQSIGTILKNKSQVLDKTNFNFRGSIPNLAGQKEPGSSSGSLRNVCSVQNLSTLNEEAKKGHADDVLSVPGMPSFDDVMCREVGFIMLQLINGLKSLQAKAIEELPLSLSNVVLSKEMDNKDAQSRLCVLQGGNSDEEEPMGTLCKCAHIALTEMLPATKMTPMLSDILCQERSESLSKAKSVLEFALWGPSDVVLAGSTKERELALQRWLDLERATVLHGLVRTRIELTIYDECHLMFLVRSNAKIMNDAAKIVASFQNNNTKE